MIQRLIQLNKKAVAPIMIIIVIGIIAVILSSNLININGLTATITGSGEYIERPVFYYDKCEQVGDLKYNEFQSIGKNYIWADKPSVTDAYSVNIRIDSYPLGFGGTRVKYSVCNSKVENPNNCRIFNQYRPVSRQGEQFELVAGVRPNEYVLLELQNNWITGYATASGMSYQIGWQPYGLRRYNTLGGSSVQINPNSCTYQSTQTDTIISEDLSKVIRPEGRTTDERTLQPNEIRWYVAGYVSSASPSFKLSYKNQDAWCYNGEIYKTNTIETLGGTYKVASVEWSDRLGSETCCPGDKRGDETCNKYFKWESTAGTECSAFNPCGGAEWTPFSSGKLIKYNCVKGSCEPTYKTVECASDFDCRDANKVCDLKDHTCVQANVNLDGQKIDTIPDSEAECIEIGGVWKKVTTEKKSFLNWLGIGQPEIIVTEYCSLDNGWSITDIIKWILIILASLVVIYFGWPFIKMGLNRIGVRI